MKPVNIKKPSSRSSRIKFWRSHRELSLPGRLNYKDEVVRRHRWAFVFKIVVITMGIVVVIAGLIYILFFAQIFDVRGISFNGLDTVSSDEFRGKIDENLNQKILKYLPRRNNIFFVDTHNFETEFVSAYPVFKSVDVRKKLLHGLVLNFLERKPSGVWCFNLPPPNRADGGDCFYFDEEKVLWGQPAKSSGFIFLTIEDERNGKSRQIDDEFFRPIMKVAKNMAGEIKNIIIPEGSFNEFRVYTAGYYIIFTTDSDIQDQLDVLKIFLNDKIKNSPPSALFGGGGFHPQYIDLRIDGRVYYK